MRKSLLSLAFISLAATFGAVNATAGPDKTILDTASSSTVTFTTGMGTTGVTIAGGSGNAFGSTGVLAGTTTWSIAPGSLTITPNLTANGSYGVSGTLNFTLMAGATTVLTGTLDIPNAQLSMTSSGDTLDLNANLTILSGTVCAARPTACGAGGQNHVKLTIGLDDGHATGTFAAGFVTIGKVSTLVTPEPTSMLLFGTGLLAFGGILRRKLLA